MKIKNNSAEVTYAWLAPSGAFGPGMVREVPEDRIDGVMFDMTNVRRRKVGAQPRLHMFSIVDESTEAKVPPGLESNAQLHPRVEVKPPAGTETHKIELVNPPPPPPPPPPQK